MIKNRNGFVEDTQSSSQVLHLMYSSILHAISRRVLSIRISDRKKNFQQDILLNSGVLAVC